MSEQPLIIDLSSEDRDRLETAARQLNLTLEAYVHHLLQIHLAPDANKTVAIEALRNLRAIGRQMQPIDAVKLMRQERDALAARENG